jgi:hypothetical protein
MYSTTCTAQQQLAAGWPHHLQTTRTNGTNGIDRPSYCQYFPGKAQEWLVPYTENRENNQSAFPVGEARLPIPKGMAYKD